MLSRPTRRRGESGQVLVLALAFIAFVGILTAAVLSYSSAIALQQVRTQATAAKDADAEGGAAWAAADAATGTLQCAAGATGSLTMQGGETVTYTVNSSGCNPGNTGGGPPGTNCLLCLLGTGISSNPATVLLSSPGMTVSGEVDINGSVLGQLTSTGSSKKIALLQGGTCPGCTSPPPLTHLSSPFTDPVASWIAANKPSYAGPAQAISTSNKESLTKGPGVYSTVDLANNSTLTLTTGVYVFTGQIAFGQNAALVSSGPVVFYFACPTAGPSWTCAGGGQSGGAIHIANNASIALSTFTTGVYAGISLFADPNLIDPAGDNMVYVKNNGTTFTGSVFIPSGTLQVDNNATLGIGGRVVARALSGGNNANMNLLGPGPTGVSCSVFDEAVSYAPSAGQVSSTGRVVVQVACNGRTGIVDFNYLP